MPLEEYTYHKTGVSVRLGITATPKLISAGGCDAVVVCARAQPALPSVFGATKENGVWDTLLVYGHHHELGEHVVVIGSSEIGTETALYLADNGHKVTVLTRQGQLTPESNRVHYYAASQEYWEQEERFRYKLMATTTRVEVRKIWYTDRSGVEHLLACDSIVACGGVKLL